jgi:membrane associated rhomboid family serine protease
VSIVFLGFFYQLAEVPAVIVLGFWFVLQLVSGVASLDAETAQGGVAFFAHIGGFVMGLAVGALLRVSGEGGGRPARALG